MKPEPYEYVSKEEEIAELLCAYLEENGIESKRKESHLVIDLEGCGVMVVTVHTVAGLPGSPMTIVHTSNVTLQGYRGGAMRFDMYDPNSFPEALAMIQKDIKELLEKASADEA